MSQQSDMADDVYHRLHSRPIAAAQLVRELRDHWGDEQSVSSVHGFVREVATCLLRHNDVEIGDTTASGFTPWKVEPWDAEERIDTELMAMTSFLEDESKYIFKVNSMVKY